MKVQCPHCNAVSNVDESKIPVSGVTAKCPKCQNKFRIQRPIEKEAVPPPQEKQSSEDLVVNKTTYEKKGTVTPPNKEKVKVEIKDIKTPRIYYLSAAVVLLALISIILFSVSNLIDTFQYNIAMKSSSVEEVNDLLKSIYIKEYLEDINERAYRLSFEYGFMNEHKKASRWSSLSMTALERKINFSTLIFIQQNGYLFVLVLIVITGMMWRKYPFSLLKTAPFVRKKKQLLPLAEDDNGSIKKVPSLKVKKEDNVFFSISENRFLSCPKCGTPARNNSECVRCGIHFVNFLLKICKELIEEYDFIKAIETGKIILQIDPNNAKCCFYVGICYYCLDDIEKSIAYFIKSSKHGDYNARRCLLRKFSASEKHTNFKYKPESEEEIQYIDSISKYLSENEIILGISQERGKPFVITNKSIIFSASPSRVKPPVSVIKDIKIGRILYQDIRSVSFKGKTLSLTPLEGVVYDFGFLGKENIDTIIFECIPLINRYIDKRWIQSRKTNPFNLFIEELQKEVESKKRWVNHKTTIVTIFAFIVVLLLQFPFIEYNRAKYAIPTDPKREKLIKSGFNEKGAHIELTRMIKERLPHPGAFRHYRTSYIDKGDHLLISTSFFRVDKYGEVDIDSVYATATLDGRITKIGDFQK